MAATLSLNILLHLLVFLQRAVETENECAAARGKRHRILCSQLAPRQNALGAPHWLL